MANTSEWVTVGSRKLEVSNLEKVLYPDDGVTKAEVIAYYLEVAPVMLSHIRGRPLTLIRYPDGIDSQRFYQKNTPDWAPDWVESVELGEEKKDYVLATEPATLVWLANLASLELHQMHIRQPDYESPDYMVFDLDPPEGMGFETVVEFAFHLKEHVERYGYHTFVKTTGGKGVHIVVPLEPAANVDVVFETSKQIAQEFVKRHRERATLQIRKNKRKGRILVDIYRNRSSQTIVSPYSLRGRRGIPVSMPVTWEELQHLERSNVFRPADVLEKLTSEGDVWQNMHEYAVRLHTTRPPSASGGEAKRGDEGDDSTDDEEGSKGDPDGNEDGSTLTVSEPGGANARAGSAGEGSDKRGSAENGSAEKETNASPKKYKSAEQLASYERKRNFSRTPEPKGGSSARNVGNRFVIHRHHATRLHYDLRLEKEGVLLSWAVPKGMPPRPGVKRLAVQTEDHPLEYLEFEGTIPKGEYGGGDMWIFASGTWHALKEKTRGLYFRLESTELSGEYRIYQTGDKEWLLEKLEDPVKEWLDGSIEPMQGIRGEQPPPGDYIHEVKWDGIRALIPLGECPLRIFSRNLHDITDRFPAVKAAAWSLRASCGLFDGDMVSLDQEGRLDLQKVIHRLKQSGSSAIERLSRSEPVYCYLFDCLYLDGRSVVNEPLTRRNEWLEDSLKKGGRFRISESVEDGEALFEAARQHGLEGIMAKRREGKYYPGKRTDQWVKVKIKHTADCRVIGYTAGRGGRAHLFDALHLAEEVHGSPVYRGKVGTGFNRESMQELMEVLEDLEQTDRPDLEYVPDDPQSVWVEPELIVEVSFGRLSDNGMYKEAVYQRLRPDLAI